MSEKLTDPNKAARNDGLVLQAANKNPWYVLATIYGEQPGADGCGKETEDEATFRRGNNNEVWSNWAANRLKEGGNDYDDLLRRYRKTLGDAAAQFPDRFEPIDFSKTNFENGLDCSGFEFRNSVLFGDSVFKGDAIFCNAKFNKEAYFQAAEFHGKIEFRFARFSLETIFSGA